MNESGRECQERHVLVINDGKRQAFALDAAAYSIGRDPSNAIVLSGESISRQHAILLRVPHPQTNGYRYRLIDGNSNGKLSANGIYINGRRCTSTDLTNSDAISFGRNVTAVYMTVSMGEAEFVKYLDSIAFHSIKSDVVNAKETLVSFHHGDVQEQTSTTTTTVLAQPPARPVRLTAPSPWMDTIPEDGFGCRRVAVTNDKSRQTQSDAAPLKKHARLRLWMVIAATGMVTAAIVTGLWMFFGSNAPKDGSSSVESSSQPVGQ